MKVLINMEERKRQILNIIIKEHVETGAPVGSSILVNKYKLEVSPATVRNVMAQLEEEGYIVQPHTSAGRVPTETAYRLILENIKEKKLKEAESNSIDAVFVEPGDDFRKIAKILAEITGSAVFWAKHRNDLYYTGISNLFHQPEFRETDNIYDMGDIIDRMDEILGDIFDDISFEPEVLIGADNPFGNFCSSIVVKYKKDNNSGLFGILAPMRMDYEKNLGIIKYILHKLKTQT